MPGAGASSITFWWRRCSEQSRSNRWTTLPCASPNTCTSMWRGRVDVVSPAARGRRRTRRRPRACAAASAAAKSAGRVDPAHALAAAAGHRLDQHRPADRRGLARQRARRLVVAEIAGRHRHAGLGHQPLGGVLQAHGADRGRRRADPDQAGGDHRLGEVGVLGEEAVARMDRLGAGLAAPRRGSRRRSGSSRAPAAGRSAPPRRPRARAARRRRPRNRPRRCARPAAARCG